MTEVLVGDAVSTDPHRSSSSVLLSGPRRRRRVRLLTPYCLGRRVRPSGHRRCAVSLKSCVT